MEGENIITNGVGLDDYNPPAETFDHRENEMKLNQKVEALEKEKLSLANENERVKAQIQQLTAEIESLRSDDSKLKLRLEVLEREKEQSEECKRALESFAARSLQLETEVSRLQHDLISTMTAGEEADAELSQLKKVLREKEMTSEEIRREKLEVENKLRDLETKLGAAEMRETEERSMKMKIKEEMREKMDEKDKKIDEYETKLLASEEKVREIEEKMTEIQKKFVESEKVIGGLKERSMEATNGLQSDNLKKDTKDSMVELPVLAMGFTGAILAAVLYVRYARRS